ncbi:MAG: hypothetical protein AB1762_22575 [Gemmatimonadota bacterium]
MRGQTARDSAGVRIVQHPRNAKPAATWQLGRVLARISGPFGNAREFTNVRGVARLSSESIVVANGGTNEVLFFDRRGGFQTASGRAGAGPGEFQRLTRLLRSGDTLVAVDADSRAQVFSPTGDLVRSLRAARRDGARSPQRIATGEFGSTYVVVTQGTGRDELERDTVTQLLTRSGQSGDSLSPIVAFPAYRPIRLGSAPGRLLLDAEGVVAAMDRRICIGYSDKYEVWCYAGDGRRTLRISRDVSTREIDAAERALVRRAYLDANRDAPPALRERMERAAEEFRFASRAPVFSRFVLSAAGDLWVSPFMPGFGMPGPGALLAPSAEHIWNVFSDIGAWVASIALPRRFVLYEIGVDYVAGVVFDDDDVEHVVLMELKR